MSTIVIGSDHAGFDLKEQLITHLQSQGHQVKDVGTKSAESCDYPVYARRVAETVRAGAPDLLGILVCGSGIGMSIVANKVSGIRAALVHSIHTARLARMHNNANILVLGGRLVAAALAIEMVDAWLESEYEIRHSKRLELISQLEQELYRS